MCNVDLSEAKRIMGNNYIGVEEVTHIRYMKFAPIENIPVIPYSQEELEEKKENYYLLLMLDTFSDGRPVTIRNIKEIFGKNPDSFEPCFYNQDWYDNEAFIDEKLKLGWVLIRKSVFEESRAMQPAELEKKYAFPKAVDCVYTFFVVWLVKNEKLWYHDFVWCRDVDHNGDRIYVGKYHDVDGVNKNGFSIHRHLGLRECYACIDTLR